MKRQYTHWRLQGLLCVVALLAFTQTNWAQQSVARQWSDVQLACIRKDRPRPTVQARHLAHGAIVMWDAFAAYDDESLPVLLGNTWGNFTSPFNGITPPSDIQAAQNMAISYAMYRFLWQRYATAPTFVPPANLSTVQGYLNTKMAELGYSTSITSTDYSDGDPAKLGNYIAAQMQLYALQDGCNQAGNFADTFYTPVNGQLQPQLPGNPTCYDMNRWQPMCLTLACEQGTGDPFPEPCVPVACNAPALTHEFGNTTPFAMTPDQMEIKPRDGYDWKVYLDPGAPPYLDMDTQTGLEDPFKWGYVMSSIWHSMHTASDGVTIDISPASIGNVLDYPDDITEYSTFYDLFNGGDSGEGYDINPVTGLPYTEQIVPRGDYTRVLSQYWADGPASETPPGHWFKIVNQVNDHPLQENYWGGTGPLLSDLEWDVRSYLAMGGGILDAAIACWSAKGYYDYTRPIFAIRAMCDLGQSSDDQLPNYHPAGIPLVPGYVELIEIGDPLAGDNDEYVGEIKLYTFLGPVAATGEDGVGWKRGSEWWTYQNATFVTPPFAGYYSGHSTYSRTGAEIMTMITGDEYFPGGMAEYVFAPNTLSADTGPSVEVRLQWAKYRDASDQCSLSRIYGGLHPPQDDIPGRETGAIVGPQAFDKAETFMNAGIPHISSIVVSDDMITDADAGNTVTVTITFTEDMNQTIDPAVAFNFDNPTINTLGGAIGAWGPANTYTISYTAMDMNEELSNVRWHISGAQDLDAKVVFPAISDLVRVDTRNPMVETFTASNNIFNAASAGIEPLVINFSFDEAMADVTPAFSFSESLDASVIFADGVWIDNMNYEANFNIVDNNDEFDAVGITITAATDAAGNVQVLSENTEVFSIDTKEPAATATADDNALNQADATANALSLTFTFDEMMDNASTPIITFPGEDPTTGGLAMTSGTWNAEATQYTATFDLADMDAEMFDIEVASASAMDAAGNTQIMAASEDVFSIDTKQPMVTSTAVSESMIYDGISTFTIALTFDEAMNESSIPTLTFPEGDLNSTVSFGSFTWLNSVYTATFFCNGGAGIEVEDIDVHFMGATDEMMNDVIESTSSDQFDIDTRNPTVILLTANDDDITDENLGGQFVLTIIFDEPMDTESIPAISFPDENPLAVISFNVGQSDWLNGTDNVYVAKYDIASGLDITLLDIDVQVAGLNDAAGNEQANALYEDFFDIQVGVGVAELGGQTVTVYPNPAIAGHDIIISMAQIPADLVLQVYDANGALMDAQTKANQSGNQLEIDTKNFAAGMYFINLTSVEGSVNFKVQVSK